MRRHAESLRVIAIQRGSRWEVALGSRLGGVLRGALSAASDRGIGPSTVSAFYLSIDLATNIPITCALLCVKCESFDTLSLSWHEYI